MDDDTLYGQTEIFRDQIAARIDTIQDELDELRRLNNYNCDTWYRIDAINAEWAQDYANEISAVKLGMEWPYNHIDWEAAADELKQDMIQVDFGDETYFGR